MIYRISYCYFYELECPVFEDDSSDEGLPDLDEGSDHDEAGNELDSSDNEDLDFEVSSDDGLR